MDDLTKQQRRQAKIDIVNLLRQSGRSMIEALDLEQTDDRLPEYLRKVVESPERHNLFELLAVRRFISFMQTFTFVPERVKVVILVIEALKFPQSDGMKSVRLSPVQVFILANIYGFYDDSGHRLIRNAMLFVPRKFGKTTLVAGIAIYEFLFGDADGQVYVCANSYNQAKICFDVMRRSLRSLDKFNRFRINREIVYNNQRGRTAFAQCLASDASTLDGLNASCYILDEFAQAKSAALRNVMATSTGTRENPLELIITTASELQDSPCVDTLTAYQKILLGDRTDNSVFALIFMPDVDDQDDDPLTWEKVQPHLGYTVKSDYYQRKWVKAQETAEDMVAFRTKLLNIFAVNTMKTWLSGDEIRALYKPFEWSQLDPESPPMCMVSFDLSVWDDFSAVCYEIYLEQTQSFHYHIEYYLPEESLAKHARRELYQSWVDKGFLRLLPGSVIDYEMIVNDIISHNGQVIIAGIGYDPYKAKTAVNMLKSVGATPVLKPIKQTYGEFTGSVESLEMMVKVHACSFSPNEITAWCFGNCLMDEDRLGNRKPIKQALALKIDGAICCLMSQNLFMNFKR